ncbi:MAG: LuxR C-terminal-related transcriptional regulator [Bacteroidales bacterium]|jgi:DNA-binding CsgD family transcriptional regulator|nr:LuxR C-terminal-related transcriptional regulator [Bacteroidales bacterium]
MKIHPCTTNSWKISRELERSLGPENIKKQVSAFDKICQSHLRPCRASFYMIDYREQKKIVGNLETQLLTGYHPSLIEKEGFDFLKRILAEDELAWFNRMSEAAHDVFHRTPISERLDLSFAYELIAKGKDMQEVVLSYTMVPYKLDTNGNMWLALCRVKSSECLSILGKAFVINHTTGEQLDYIDGKFLPSTCKLLTNVEIKILKYQAMGLLGKEIAEEMNISESMVKRKRQDLFDKLNVTTSAAAVYKATKMKII